MKKKMKKYLLWTAFVILILATWAVSLAPFVVPRLSQNGAAPSAPRAQAVILPCKRVTEVLEKQLRQIEETKEASYYLERAKMLNRLSLEACTEEERERYFQKALAELQVADALRALDSVVTDVSRQVGFYWKERAEFFRLHRMADRELEIYEELLEIPGRGRDIYALARKAEVFARIGRLADAIDVYADVAEICRTSNSPDCYLAAVQFADLLEENADSRTIIAGLKRRWPREPDLRDLFKVNGAAAARIRAVLK